MYMPWRASKRLEELNTAGEDDLGMGSAAGRTELIRRQEEWRPHPGTPSQTQGCGADTRLRLAPVLTAAVTGTAGISIPGIMGGTIPGICRNKEDKTKLARCGQAQAGQGTETLLGP